MASHCVPIELANDRPEEWKRREVEIWNSRHVERDEELEVSAGILSSLVRVGNLTGLPVAGSDVEGEGIDAVIVGEFDVLQPSILGIGEGVSHHMVSGHDLLPGNPLRNCRKVRNVCG